VWSGGSGEQGRARCAKPNLAYSLLPQPPPGQTVRLSSAPLLCLTLFPSLFLSLLRPTPLPPQTQRKLQLSLEAHGRYIASLMEQEASKKAEDPGQAWLSKGELLEGGMDGGLHYHQQGLMRACSVTNATLPDNTSSLAGTSTGINLTARTTDDPSEQLQDCGGRGLVDLEVPENFLEEDSSGQHAPAKRLKL
jgi:hypothetical protein